MNNLFRDSGLTHILNVTGSVKVFLKNYNASQKLMVSSLITREIINDSASALALLTQSKF